jgi:hypothetical protein
VRFPHLEGAENVDQGAGGGHHNGAAELEGGNAGALLGGVGGKWGVGCMC